MLVTRDPDRLIDGTCCPPGDVIVRRVASSYLIGRAIRWRHSWLLVTAIGTGAVAAACSSERAVATSPTQLKCQVTLAASPASIGPDGGTGRVAVTTTPECPWDVSTAANWLSGLSPTSGQGSGTVEYRAAPNPLPSVREGDIVVNETSLRVSQQAACRVEFRSGSLTIDAGGGSREVALSAPSGCSWTAATDASWISFTTPVTRSGDGSVGVSIAPHAGGEPRVGTIAVADQRFMVRQDAPASRCVYSITSAHQGAVPSGGADVSGSVTVASGCAWTASSNAAWITVIAGASGTGSGAVVFRVAPNVGSVRTGTVTVAGKTFVLTQAALVCTYAISPSSLTVRAAGGTGTVAVSAGSGCAWTARSEDSWIAISSGAAGNGNGTVALVVADHKGKNDRTGTVTIAGRTFRVTQREDDD
jgi:hypothetical protein